MSKTSNVLVPTVIESDGHIERTYDIYSRLLKDRIVFLGENVNHHTANLVMAQMLFLEAEDPKQDIIFYINSPGGSIYDGLAIYDTMQYVKCDIQTIGVGVQASMAAFLLSSGAKAKRFVLPNSKILIHQPSSGTKGRVTDMEIDLKEVMALKKRLNQLLTKNTGQKLSKIEKDVEKDFWMNAQEAKKYGLIDEIITRR